MINFIIYNILNGSIIRHGICQEELFYNQVLNENEAIMQGIVTIGITNINELL